jgi:hypothetical protein
MAGEYWFELRPNHWGDAFPEWLEERTRYVGSYAPDEPKIEPDVILRRPDGTETFRLPSTFLICRGQVE